MKLQTAIKRYVEAKQAQGLHFKSTAQTLYQFCNCVGDGIDCNAVSDPQVASFIARTNTPGSNYPAQKHGILKRFYSYAIRRGFVSRSPLPQQSPKRYPSAPPYIYSDDDVCQLLAATDCYSNRICQLQPQTLRTLLLLLYSTGLRPGEALKLQSADVDLPNALLTVRDTKFHKSRLVPLPPTIVTILEAYASQRSIASASFLTNKDGTALVHGSACCAFRKLCQTAGVTRQNPKEPLPRLHDLRHTFAVNRLIAWYRQGADLKRMLPLLSVYMGHVCLSGTQVYLTMTPELLEEAAMRFERYAQPGGEHVC